MNSSQHGELLALAKRIELFATEHHARELTKHADLMRLARDLERLTEQVRKETRECGLARSDSATSVPVSVPVSSGLVGHGCRGIPAPTPDFPMNPGRLS